MKYRIHIYCSNRIFNLKQNYFDIIIEETKNREVIIGYTTNKLCISVQQYFITLSKQIFTPYHSV